MDKDKFTTAENVAFCAACNIAISDYRVELGDVIVYCHKSHDDADYCPKCGMIDGMKETPISALPPSVELVKRYMPGQKCSIASVNKSLTSRRPTCNCGARDGNVVVRPHTTNCVLYLAMNDDRRRRMYRKFKMPYPPGLEVLKRGQAGRIQISANRAKNKATVLGVGK